ncbi:MAG: hypothetical protein V1932_01300 [Chloroflexota bacterium]
MIKTKTVYKLLRNLGIVLIAMPEPFTTPIGAAITLSAIYLSRRLEISQNKLLRETFKNYLDHHKRFSEDSTTPGNTRYTQTVESSHPGQYEVSPGFKPNPRPLVRQSSSDTGDNVICHTIDMEWLSRRYKTDDSPKVKPDWTDTSSTAQGVIHHTINMELLSRRYKSEDNAWADSDTSRTSKIAEKTIHHTINIRSLPQWHKTDDAAPVKLEYHAINWLTLLRRYGLAAGSASVLKA